MLLLRPNLCSLKSTWFIAFRQHAHIIISSLRFNNVFQNCKRFENVVFIQQTYKKNAFCIDYKSKLYYKLKIQIALYCTSNIIMYMLNQEKTKYIK